MEAIFYIISGVSLIGMWYQDITQRRIHLVFVALLFFVTITREYYNNTFDLSNAAQILAFLAATIVGLVLYVSFKEQRMVNPFAKHMGIGDLYFFMAIIPLFTLRNYLIFFISGLLVSLVFFVLVRSRLKYKTIPLAGYLSLYLGFWIILDAFMIPAIFKTVLL